MKSNLKISLKSIIFVFTFICGFSTMYGQFTIQGEINVAQGQSYTYTISGGDISFLNWVVPIGGNVISQNTSQAVVEWTGIGEGIVVAQGQDSFSNSIDIALHVTITGTTPPSPPNPTVQSSSCGTVTLERTGTPPTGTTWFWQSTPTGEDTSNSTSTITLTSGTIYYLRAKYNGGLWSDSSSSVSFTVQEMLIWYADTDGDGLGDPNTTQSSCDQPAGYVSNNSDQCPNESGAAADNGCPSSGTGTNGISFDTHTIRDNFDGSGRSVAIDLDNDDDIDIVSTANLGSKVVWFENDGHEIFTEHEIIINFENAWNLKVLDIDHDGDLDIWAAGVNSESVGSGSTWFENDGAQEFTVHNIIDMFGVPLASPSDFNGDGVIDFVQYDYSTDESVNYVTWYEGVPSQNYISHTTTVATAPNLRYINFGLDIDQDIDTDYIAKDTITNEFFLFENQNGLSFEKKPMTIDIEDQGNINFLQTLDLDKDGDQDLLAISQVLNRVYWYENSGSLSYTKHTIDSANAYPFEISSTDINQDGYNDIVVSSYSDNQIVGYINDGQQNFTKQELGSVSGPVYHFLVDIDDDNDDDIVVNGYVADKVVWLETKLATPKNSLNLSQDQNYIYSITPQVKVKNETELNGLTNRKDALETVAYFDGLGRPKQQVAIGQNPKGNDIVNYVAYDEFGRQDQDFLPYVAINNPNDGRFNTDNQKQVINDYYTSLYSDDLNLSNPNPYSKKLFEISPLNRVLEQTAPGVDWKSGENIDDNGHTDGHTIKFDYQNNTLNLTDDTQDNVRLFKVSLDNNFKPTLENNKTTDYYAVGELYKTIIKDENWIANQSGAKAKNYTAEEFKDKLGRVVLKRTYNANTTNTSIKNTKHDTYYVYDDFGNLTYVIPPRANINNNQSTRTRALNELCYQYRYDNKNRLIRKKIPGKGWESIVYDKLDHPILTQTKNLKDKGKWLFTKYDAFGRVVYTGKYTSSQNRNQLQTQANTYTATNLYEDRQTETTIGDASLNYTHKSFPIDNLKVLTINYYDDYNFNLDGGTNPIDVLGVQITTNTKSLAIASQVRVLGTDKWINTITYYDQKARPIYGYSKNNYLNTVDITKTQLDFIGNVQRTVTRHTKGNNPTIKTIDRFTYDHANRLKKQTQQINNKEVEVLAENEYDELGQLIKKGVGNQPLGKHLQDIDYTYNIRGWLKSINNPELALTDDLFAFKLNYNTISTTAGGTSRLSTEELYNGNISETIWRTANDNKKRGYGYKYDALNRIKRARYKAGENLTTENQFFDIKGVNYDKNGNIKKLNRFSPNNDFTNKEATDQLTYKYFQLSNKLKSVTDASGSNKGFKDGNTSNDDYAYDADGNLTSDKNKGINNIKYNHLNLPTVINFGGGNKIKYFYDAVGTKLKKQVTDNGTITTTEYMANGAVYENDALQFIPTAEGYVTKSGYSWSYIYQYKDHLGNIRLSYSDSNGDGQIQTGSSYSEIIEENNYYPFGLKHKGYNFDISANGNSVAQKIKYNGIELEESLELNLYEMDFRQYDPAIARFTSIDPIIHASLSPYEAFDNNPVFWKDPSGASVEVSEDGDKITYTGQDAVNLFLALRGGSSSSENNERNSEECCGGIKKFFKEVLDKSWGKFTKDTELNDENYWLGDDGYTYYVTDKNEFYRIYFDTYEKVDELPPMMQYIEFSFGSGVVKKGIRAFGRKAGKTTMVYLAKKGAKIIYIGITNNFARRAAQHLSGPNKLKIQKINDALSNLSRKDAKAVEQVLIEYFGLGGKKGQKGKLLNRINSIAQKNDIYAKSLKRGKQLLEAAGVSFF